VGNLNTGLINLSPDGRSYVLMLQGHAQNTLLVHYFYYKLLPRYLGTFVIC